MDELSNIKGYIRGISKEIKRISSLLKKVEKGVQNKDYLFVKKVLEGEINVSDNFPVLKAKIEELKLSILKEVNEELSNLRLSLISNLNEKLKDKPLKRLTTDEFFLEPFTFKLNFEKGEITLYYAREKLETMPLNLDKLKSSYEKYVEQFEEYKKEGVELIFDRILKAYRGLLGIEGRNFGDKVRLVRLLPILKIIVEEREEKVLKDYPRYRLSWDLWYLRSCRSLTKDNLKLQLGPATAGTAQNKKDVLWIEEGEGQGGWYLSLWFSRI